MATNPIKNAVVGGYKTSTKKPSAPLDDQASTRHSLRLDRLVGDKGARLAMERLTFRHLRGSKSLVLELASEGGIPPIVARGDLQPDARQPSSPWHLRQGNDNRLAQPPAEASEPLTVPQVGWSPQPGWLDRGCPRPRFAAPRGRGRSPTLIRH